MKFIAKLPFKELAYLLVLFSILLALTFGWKFIPGSLVESYKHWLNLQPLWLVLLVFLLAYALGSTLMIPINILIITALLLLGPVKGAFVSLAGSMLASVTTYFLGYWAGQKLLNKYADKIPEKLKKASDNPSLAAIITIRILPILPFTWESMIFGAFQTRFLSYFIGSSLAMVPGIVALALVRYQAGLAFEMHLEKALPLLLLSIIILVALFWLTRYLLTKRGDSAS